MTLDQLIAHVTRTADALPALQPEHSGDIRMAFYRVDASPDDIAAALRLALPDWPKLEVHAVPHDPADQHDYDTAWTRIENQNVKITTFVTHAHATAYLASLAARNAA